MVEILCECNGGVDGIDKLPPHLHVRQGLVDWPEHLGGGQRWLNGAISDQERVVLQFDSLQFTQDDLAVFVAKVRYGGGDDD